MPKTIRERLASYLTRSMSPDNPSTPLSAIARWLNSGNQTVAGEEINSHIALQITTVRAAVTVLSESVASLPCILYEKTNKGRIEADGHPLHYVLGTEPNNEMSAFTFWETMVGCNALTGNSYAEIAWTKGGQVGELYPLNPLMTEPYRLPNGKLAYRTRQGASQNGTPSDQLNVNWRTIAQEDVLHFRLFSFDGLIGLSPVTLARQALGLTRAAEKFGAKFFGNGTKPGGILTGPTDMDEVALSDSRKSWEAAQGASNQGRVAVLSGEWDYKQIGLSPEDSQFLLTRVFQRSEIAAMFRVPAHMVGDTSKISNGSYEQMTLSFVADTLRPILTRIESELNRKLLPQAGRKANKYFVKFDLTERLRSDHETTTKGIALGRQWGLITGNEGRLALGMNPIDLPEADALIIPVNMTNMKQLLIQAKTDNMQEQPLPLGTPEGTDPDPEDKPPTQGDLEDIEDEPQDESAELLLTSISL